MKKILKKLHLYLALVFCLPLIIQGLSGSLLVFRSEISDFILRQNYEFSQGEIRPAFEIIAAVEKTEEENLAFVRMPFKAQQPAIIRLSNKKLNRDIFIDPVSLQIIKTENPAEGFFYFVKKLHTNLLIDGPQSRVAIGCLGLILLFMAISGIILFWPKLKHFSQSIKFNFQLKRRAFHRSLHKVFGFWSFAIVFVSSFSGIYLAFPDSTAAVISKVFHNQNSVQNLKNIKIEAQKDSANFDLENAIFVSLDEIKKSAAEPKTTEEALVNNLQILSINFPQKPDQPYRFNFIKKDYDRGEPLTIALFNQSQQKVLLIKNPDFYNVAEKIIAWQHALHAGEGLGIIWAIIIFLMGLSPILFTITGLKMWMKKT